MQPQKTRENRKHLPPQVITTFTRLSAEWAPRSAAVAAAFASGRSRAGKGAGTPGVEREGSHLLQVRGVGLQFQFSVGL